MHRIAATPTHVCFRAQVRACIWLPSEVHGSSHLALKAVLTDEDGREVVRAMSGVGAAGDSDDTDHAIKAFGSWESAPRVWAEQELG